MMIRCVASGSVALLLAAAAGMGLAPAAAADTATPELVILPEAIVLRGADARQQLLVALAADGRFVGDRTAEATFASSDPAVVGVDAAGLLTAVGDGRAVVTAAAGGRTAKAVVSVEQASAPPPITFRNHVLPVLTKAGCNSGPCHGALAGKNGLKLTLRGYDPELDYLFLSRHAGARRINPVEPAQSLMLLKPTLAVSHGGGRRLSVGSQEYGVLAQWIASGMPGPADSDPQMTRLEVVPARVRLTPEARQQILVRAHFSDGRAEDVTRWAKFSTSDPAVATVDEDGLVRVHGPGEAAISVWYLSQVAASRVTSPFATSLDPGIFRHAARRNFIDDHVLRKLEELGIEPSGLSPDEAFLRRAYLDAIGVLPTPDEVRRFLADRSPAKRERLVDALLERPEYVDYWTYKWADLLLVSSRRLQRPAMWAYYDWIRRNVETNVPWDRMVHELLTVSGHTLAHGAANYYVLHKNPIAIVENVSVAFMGFSITCARCHNHPLEKWTQHDYYRMANLFARVGLKNGSGRGDIVVYSTRTGEINHPRLNEPLTPQPLDGPPLPGDSAADRRRHFADWLVAPGNPFFARTLVNRVWQQLMGRGLVEAVDDIRDTNPPSNPELLDALSRDFVAHGFDVRHLVRTIMTSGTYQLTSVPNDSNRDDLVYHSRYVARRLPAEVILDAISQVTGVPEAFTGHPAGTRALQLPDTQVDSYFLTAFGRPPRLVTVASERQQEPSIAQALHVINGDTINRKLRAEDGLVQELIDAGASVEQAVEAVYLAALSRFPTKAETRTIAAAIDPGPDAEPAARRAALEDLVWAVLTGKEFLFNH